MATARSPGLRRPSTAPPDLDGDGVLNEADATPLEILRGQDDWLSRDVPISIPFDVNGNYTGAAAGSDDAEFTDEDALANSSVGAGPGKLSFAFQAAVAAEAGLVARARVSRAGGTSGAISADYEVVAGTDGQIIDAIRSEQDRVLPGSG